MLECEMLERNFNSLLKIENCLFKKIFFFSRTLQHLHSSKANFITPFLLSFFKEKKVFWRLYAEWYKISSLIKLSQKYPSTITFVSYFIPS